MAGALLGNFYSAGEGVLQRHARVRAARGACRGFVEQLRAHCGAAGRRPAGSGHSGRLADLRRASGGRCWASSRAAEAQGARLVIGGARLTAGDLANGCFVAPTVFTTALSRRHGHRAPGDLRPGHVKVLEFDTEAEVIERANATEFGLAAGVFTGNDLTRAHRVIAELQKRSTCWINHYNVTPVEELPFGGVKLSAGLGRENGRAALEHYTPLRRASTSPWATSTPPPY